MSRVFVSYASQDRAAADVLCAALEAAQIPCWIAPRDVAPGQSYAAAIVEAINACRLLLLVLSQNSIASPHVLREVERASSKQRIVLTVRLDAAVLPPELEYFLSANQWLDAAGGSVERITPALVDSVRRYGGDAPRAAERAGAGAVGGAPVGGPAAFPPARPAALASFARRERKPIHWTRMVLALAGMGVGLVFSFGDRWWPERRERAPAPTAVPATAPDPAPAAAATPVPAGPPAANGPSVAVLPFADLSERKDQEYFSDGLSDELIDLLAQIPGLHVPARTSSFYFKGKQVTLGEIGRALGVSSVLEGSVRKSGNHLRINAELVRVADDSRIWSKSYDRKLDDVFKVQDEIAGAVVHALQVSLLTPIASEHRTDNAEAYNHFLLGRQLLAHFEGGQARRAAEEFRRATALDPGYAAAWAGLGEAHFWMADAAGDAVAMEEDRREARAAADKAIALQPTLAYGYMVRSFIRTGFDLDWDGSNADSRRALALEPDNPEIMLLYGSGYLLCTGRLSDAVALLRKAAAADPLNARIWAFLGLALLSQGDPAATREALGRSLEISPAQTYTPSVVGKSYLLEGRPAEALAASQESTSELYRLFGGALAQYDLGRRADSDRQLADLIDKYGFSAAFQIAEVYAWRGDPDHAFEWLERALAQHDTGMSYLKVDPMLRKIRADPRYAVLLGKVHLT